MVLTRQRSRWSRPPRDDGLAAEKAPLRRLYRDRRRAAAFACGDRLAESFLATTPLAPGATVSGYWPFADEIDPRPLMVALCARGHPLCLPVAKAGEPLSFRAWTPGSELEAGVFDTRVPPPQSPVLRPDCLIVPLLACDREGFRLGYGGGYYDRTLAALAGALAVGVGFAFQRVERLPRGAHDRRLDWLVSEAGAERFAAAAP